MRSFLVLDVAVCALVFVSFSLFSLNVGAKC
jgi:hypothetical protein